MVADPDAFLKELAEATSPADQPASSRALKRGINYSHQAMIDMIISCPGISQNDLALHFGYSASWISTMMATDAFQSALAKRREEVVDPLITATVEERMKGLHMRSVAILEEKLAADATNIPDNLALRSFELTSRALGYGAREQTKVEINNNNYIEGHAAQLVTLLRKTKDQLSNDQEPIDVIPEGQSPHQAPRIAPSPPAGEGAPVQQPPLRGTSPG